MLSNWAKSKKAWFPEYLQVLVPESDEDAGGGEDWEGRVSALKGAVEKVRETMNKELKAVKAEFRESEKKREEAEVRQQNSLSRSITISQ